MHVHTCWAVCVAMYFFSLLTFFCGGALGGVFAFFWHYYPPTPHSRNALTADPFGRAGGEPSRGGGGCSGGGRPRRTSGYAQQQFCLSPLSFCLRPGEEGSVLSLCTRRPCPPPPGPRFFSPSPSRRGLRVALFAWGAPRGTANLRLLKPCNAFHGQPRYL